MNRLEAIQSSITKWEDLVKPPVKDPRGTCGLCQLANHKVINPIDRISNLLCSKGKCVLYPKYCSNNREPNLFWSIKDEKSSPQEMLNILQDIQKAWKAKKAWKGG